MKKEIHDSNSEGNCPEGYMCMDELDEYQEHNSKEKECSDDSSFDELLNIPTLRNIVGICFFELINILVDDISICWS
jgi:hypothetical protein